VDAAVLGGRALDDLDRCIVRRVVDDDVLPVLERLRADARDRLGEEARSVAHGSQDGDLWDGHAHIIVFP
jgi:hypothetical protein